MLRYFKNQFTLEATTALFSDWLAYGFAQFSLKKYGKDVDLTTCATYSSSSMSLGWILFAGAKSEPHLF